MTVFRFTWLFCIRLLIYCTVVLGTSKKKPNAYYDPCPRPMAWARVKKKPTHIMPRAHGLWSGHEKEDEQ